MIRESNGLFSELGRKRYLRKFNQMFYKLYFHLSKKINYISIKTLHVSKKKQQNCTKKKKLDLECLQINQLTSHHPFSHQKQILT
jgi:hypothetical protein